MGEALRSAGVRAVQQCRARSWDEAAAFTARLRESLDARGLPFKCVVKPTRSAGSDGVTFCSSEEEVKAAVETLVKTENIFGEANGEVVCQEFLSGQGGFDDRGVLFALLFSLTLHLSSPPHTLSPSVTTEYVVDTVSSGGVHKCVAVWVYDKRRANGAQFVYYGMAMVDGSTSAGPVPKVSCCCCCCSCCCCCCCLCSCCCHPDTITTNLLIPTQL